MGHEVDKLGRLGRLGGDSKSESLVPSPCFATESLHFRAII
jgi:hypothetical protein